MLSVAFVPNTSTLQLSPGRVPAAEAHRGGAAAVQLCDDLRAIRVLGACSDPGDSDFDRTELLTRQPAHLVELVDAHVDEDATTTRPELQWRRCRVPLIAARPPRMSPNSPLSFIRS